MVDIGDYAQIPPRARLGFIIPSSNRMVEPQIQHYCPEGVVPHFNRIGMTNRHKAPLEVLKPRIVEAAELLADSKVDVTVLQCTGTSMSGGVDPEKEIIQAMAQATGRPAISTASSLMAALAAVNANRIVFVSESPADHHASKEAYLRDAGLDIAASKGMALPRSDVYCVTTPEYWLDCVSEMRDDSVDAYFVSCANIHATYVIDQLEERLDRPVLTSNQVALWCALRTVGIDDDVPELGRLFKQGLVMPAAASAAE